jgi:hypothetical protein
MNSGCFSLRLLPPMTGEVWFDIWNITTIRGSGLREVRIARCYFAKPFAITIERDAPAEAVGRREALKDSGG